MNTITLTDEQMKALQSGQSITIEPPKPVITKWEPKHKSISYFIDFSDSSVNFIGHYYDSRYGKHLSNLGFTYDTKAQAEQAAKALRSYARQLNWLHENDDGWVANWENSNQYKHFVYFHNLRQMYLISHDYLAKSIGLVYMSKPNADKLCQLLNDGIVEF
jgi:hypothetical protein